MNCKSLDWKSLGPSESERRWLDFFESLHRQPPPSRNLARNVPNREPPRVFDINLTPDDD